MQTLFADTGFFVALLNPKDELHARARRLRERLSPFHVITTEMVLTEFLNDFGARGMTLRLAAASFVEQLRQGASAQPSAATIVPQTPHQFVAALETYHQRDDKAWSLTDCASYLIMREQGLMDALTHDRHFEQMGFRALLRQNGPS